MSHMAYMAQYMLCIFVLLRGRCAAALMLAVPCTDFPRAREMTIPGHPDAPKPLRSDVHLVAFLA